MGNLFDQARSLAAGNPALSSYIEDLYNRQLMAHGNAEELASRGQTREAIDMYAQQGDWDKVSPCLRLRAPSYVSKLKPNRSVISLGGRTHVYTTLFFLGMLHID